MRWLHGRYTDVRGMRECERRSGGNRTEEGAATGSRSNLCDGVGGRSTCFSIVLLRLCFFFWFSPPILCSLHSFRGKVGRAKCSVLEGLEHGRVLILVVGFVSKCPVRVLRVEMPASSAGFTSPARVSISLHPGVLICLCRTTLCFVACNVAFSVRLVCASTLLLFQRSFEDVGTWLLQNA